MRRAIVTAIVLALLTIGAAAATRDGGFSRPEVAHAAVHESITLPGPQADWALAEREQSEQIQTYVAAVEHAHVTDYLNAQAALVRAYVASLPPIPAPAPRPSTPASSPVTGACGGATNGADQFIQRESGGNPGVYNSGGSGAWGCYQIMPGTWAGAGCDQFGAYGSASPAAQAECASRLPMSAWGG